MSDTINSITRVEVSDPTVADLRAILDRHPETSRVEVEHEYMTASAETLVTLTIHTEIDRPAITKPYPILMNKDDSDNDIKW